MAKSNGGTRAAGPTTNSVIERLQNSKNWLIAAGMQRYEEEKNNPAWDYSDMAKLSDIDKTYLVAYLSNSYSPINKALRSGEPLSQDVGDMVKGIDKAITKLNPYKGTVYRGIEFGDTRAGVREQEQLLTYYKSNVGGNIIEKGYLSTGKIQTRISRKFTSTVSPSIKFTIDSKTGRDLSRYNNEEHEVLFKRGTRFKVISVRGNNIHLSEI